MKRPPTRPPARRRAKRAPRAVNIEQAYNEQARDSQKAWDIEQASGIEQTDDAADETWGKDLVKLAGDQDAMLDGIRDYLWDIKGPTDISDIVRDYFDKNGYDFDSSDDDDDDDWDDDDWED